MRVKCLEATAPPQFTLERDLNIYRGEQVNLETSVYRKLTHTDHKKSVAKTLLSRADCLSTSLDSKAEERKYVSNVLEANGCTKTFLRNCRKTSYN